MRPDLALSPAGGSAVATGDVSVSWVAPSAGSVLTVLLGTTPGDADLGRHMLGAGHPIEFEMPARRVYVSAWLSSPDLPGAPVHAYSTTYWATNSLVDLATDTVARQILGTYWLEGWMGENLDEKRFCPAAVLGFPGSHTTFSYDRDADVSPWTPAEVRGGVGYALLRFREANRFDDAFTAGIDPDTGRVVSSEYLMYELDFEFALPSKSPLDAATTFDARLGETDRLFRGFYSKPEGTSVLSLRQLGRYPIRRRTGGDDGAWRRTNLTVPIRARVRRIHAGNQEVALP